MTVKGLDHFEQISFYIFLLHLEKLPYEEICKKKKSNNNNNNERNRHYCILFT